MTAPHTWPRLFVTDSLGKDMILNLSIEQSHYLINVMRAQEGSKIRVFNGKDGEWLASLESLPKSKKRPLSIIVEENYRLQTDEPDLWLCAAPIRRAHYDFMVMKATELGVSVIQPLITAHTSVRDVNLTRLQAIACEAAEQSERLTVPEIKQPQTLTNLIRNWPTQRLPILCAEFGQAQPIAKALSSALAQTHPAAAILTGPEGGFTTEEMNSLQAMPEILPLRLGPRILRADTAAIAAISCWQSLCGDWQSEKGTRNETYRH